MLCAVGEGLEGIVNLKYIIQIEMSNYFIFDKPRLGGYILREL